jgi:hypothetical protein
MRCLLISASWLLGLDSNQQPSEPAAQRRLCFTGSAACKETLDADVFVKIRPVDALAFTYQSPMLTFDRGPVGQSRVPRQGYRDGATIDQFNDQRVLGE